MSIFFHDKVYGFRLKNQNYYKEWLKKVIYYEKREIGEISIVFISDEAILKINNSYLKHDYYTDVIAFNYSK